MAKYLLLRDVDLAGRGVVPAGIVDSSQYDIADLRASGAGVIPWSDTTLAALQSGSDLVASVLGAVYWDDIQGPISTALRGASSLDTELYRDVTNSLYEFLRHTRDAYFTTVYQMPHGWVRTAVNPHWHALPMASADGVAVLTMQYAWGRVGRELPAASGWTTVRKEVAISASDQYKEIAVSFGPIEPPAWSDASTNLHCLFARLGDDAADTYTGSKVGGTAAANLGVAYVDCHFQRSLLGSISEFPG